MRAFNIVFAFLFIVFAALQYNDPDPYIWMPLYLYTAWLCALAVRNVYPKNLYIIGLIGYSIYATYLFFNETGVLNWLNDHQAESIVQKMRATKPWIEATREFFGLMIMITVLVINMIWLRKNQPARTVLE